MNHTITSAMGIEKTGGILILMFTLTIMDFIEGLRFLLHTFPHSLWLSLPLTLHKKQTGIVLSNSCPPIILCAFFDLG